MITQTALDDDPEDRATTLGRALPHTEVKIVDVVSGETVAPGVVGEICTRGYHVMTGYFDDPAATAAAIDADGWLHTGDLASMDERGYCRIEGRLKDMIIRGGENIYPREIEQVLFEHEDVADVAVVGDPGREVGRAGRGVHPSRGGPLAGSRRPVRPLPRASGAAQDAAALVGGRRLPADAVGQGAEVRPARAVPRSGEGGSLKERPMLPACPAPPPPASTSKRSATTGSPRRTRSARSARRRVTPSG